MDIVNLILVIFLSILSIVFLFWIKEILKKKGYKVSGFISPTDYVKMFNLIFSTEDRSQKKKYIILLSASITSPVLMLVALTTGMDTVDDWQCKRYNDFLSYSMQGVVVDKYIDKPNHAFKTLIVASNNGNFKDVEISIFVPEVYELIAKGDTIVKELNSPNVLIKSNSGIKLFSDLHNPCDPAKGQL
jgi:hypothetical protein